MQSDHFQALARHVVQKYRDSSQTPDDRHHPVYLLTFGVEVDIHLIGSQPGYLNLVATFPAPPQWLAPEGMRALLAENVFSLFHPALMFGLETMSGNMVISLRQPLAELNENNILHLVESFAQRAIDFHSGKILPPAQIPSSSKQDALSKTNFATMTIQSSSLRS
ncbi:CesT family type III secretion system chaperone [Pseudomonas cichorii]|uniref:CesT family type III secretion system chaperone n=1 Tax=Pseudomonas cichorii TaxID=36746 RepID=UPI001C8A4DEE|nr:CesT family type III secretion system chaperone [Pseudomonas cichorii]MBX8574098.1 CesT family type III secretion system chaperone [Pseudomonas cichorii]